jgi:hypothetical protein
VVENVSSGTVRCAERTCSRGAHSGITYAGSCECVLVHEEGREIRCCFVTCGFALTGLIKCRVGIAFDGFAPTLHLPKQSEPVPLFFDSMVSLAMRSWNIDSMTCIEARKGYSTRFSTHHVRYSGRPSHVYGWQAQQSQNWSHCDKEGSRMRHLPENSFLVNCYRDAQ